jgi:uncharacterized membrane protein
MTDTTSTQQEKIEEAQWPQRKVWVPAVAGFVVASIVFILNNFVITDEKKKVPSELSALATPVVTGIIAYLITPGRDERLIVKSNQSGKYVTSARIKKEKNTV